MSDEKKEGCGELLVALAVSFPAMAIYYPIWGYVFAKLWAWFAVPQFGVASMSPATAIGLALLISAVRRTPEKPKDKTSLEYVIGQSAEIVSKATLLLLIGYAAHKWGAP